MQIGSGDFTYEWIDNWAKIPDTESGRANGRTHGVVVNDDGHVHVFNQAHPAVLEYDADGKLVNSWGDRFGGAHGMTLVKEEGEEYLWLTDQESAEVVKTTLDGRTVQNIEKPDHRVYHEAKYVPTWVAVHEKRFGGNGDIWVTDGYGSSHIHRYDEAGNYIQSINGEEGEAGAFACPHGIMFSYRGAAPELYVADRSNKRIQVYDAEGNYKRVVENTVHSPCGFVFQGDACYIPELFAGVKILDREDKVAANLGDNQEVTKVAGWPNLAGTSYVQPGRFNSPHGIAVAENGDVFVVEWIIGGRITKLRKV